ncbi:MAG TPA: DUF998 domain-containing protein [Nitrososphaerales archaeon]|nr:DUF998 domain-containing protein [Nitrososphaerales archaeon]
MSEGAGRTYFAATVVGIALYVVLDAIAQSLPPHYSPISQAESDLAVGPYGYVMTINFVNRGLFSLLFLAGLRTLPSWQSLRSGMWLVAVWAIGALILAAAPTDVGGHPTVHGVVHLVVASLAFLCGAAGSYMISRALSRDPALKELARYSSPLAALSVVAFLGLFLLPAITPRLDSSVGGLVERLLIGSILAWMLSISLPMLGRRKPP